MELNQLKRPVKAIIYTRVSTKEQVEGYSLTYQEKLCKEHCVREDWEVIKIFQEQGESAKTADRTQLLNLLKYVQENKGKVDVVLIHKIDRVARNLENHVAIRATLSKFGVMLRSVSENINETSQGKLVENIFATFAQFDNDLRSERTISGMREKLSQGLWAWGAPPGYKNSPSGLVIDKEIAPFIQKAFEVYSRGIYTIKDIAKKLNKWGMRSRGGKKILPQLVTKIFENKLYIGEIEVKKWNIETQGLHPPLISKEIFYKVQAIRKGRSFTAVPRLTNNPEFPLKNIAMCMTCDSNLTASWSRGRHGTRYGYYHCVKCGKTRIAKNLLEGAFYNKLQKIEPNDKVKKLFKEVLLDVWRQKQMEATTSVDRIDRNLITLREMKNKLVEKNLQGVLPDNDFREQNISLNSQIQVKEIERSEYRDEETNIDYLVSLSESIFTGVALVWAEATMEDKLRFQHLLFPKGIFYEDKSIRTPELGLPFALISESRPSKTTLVRPEGIEPPTE